MVSGGFFFLSLIFIYFNLRKLGSPIILHFDQFNGIDKFGEKSDLLGIWFTGLGMALINTLLGEAFFHRERFISYILIAVNILIAILVFLISAVIINVN